MPTRNELAKIHIAKKELWLSEDLYRDFLYILFGKKSAKDLNPKEVEELLTHFMGLGWQPTGPGHQRAGSKQQANPNAFENLPSQPKKYDDLGDRPGMAYVHEQDVPPGQSDFIRTEHGVNRADPAARLPNSPQAFAHRTLE